ncbi:MAG: SusD/RagB family nutrient-binding outer membrane lipoprotein, partial [Candidatus Nephrothrix sp. EaCA]
MVTKPDIKYLLTYSEENIFTYQVYELAFECMEQLMRYSQYASTDPYEFFIGGVNLPAGINTRYGAFYSKVLPNLFEIRRQISLYPNQENYQYMGAVTYILQVFFGIKVTDMNGS